MRSSLTLLGIVFGAASIIALSNIVYSSKQTMLKEFDALGLRHTAVSFYVEDYNEFELLYQNLDSLKIQLPGVSQFAIVRSGFEQLYHQGVAEDVSVLTTTPNLQSMLNLKLESGRFISEFNRDENHALVGHALVEQYYEHSIIIAPGDLISVGNIPFKVIGILDPTPQNGLLSFDFDNSIILPVNTHKYFGGNLGSGTVVILRDKETDHSFIEKTIINLLQAVRPGNDYFATSPESFIEHADRQIETVSLLGNAISAISLLTGGIGVLNIMLVAVSERRREIGLRRAVGATRRNIHNQFLLEAFILCFVGGLVGSLLGVLAAAGFSAFTGIGFYLVPSSIALGLGLCSVVGVTFGYYPAFIATRVEPVAALYSS